VIGRGAEIPWDLPDDRRHFRELTWGHPIVLGRKTFETLDGPLPGRLNIILTRDRTYRAAGCRVVHERDEVLVVAGDTDELFICGGGEVYREFLPLAERIYLTVLYSSGNSKKMFRGTGRGFHGASRADRLQDRGNTPVSGEIPRLSLESGVRLRGASGKFRSGLNQHVQYGHYLKVSFSDSFASLAVLCMSRPISQKPSFIAGPIFLKSSFIAGPALLKSSLILLPAFLNSFPVS